MPTKAAEYLDEKTLDRLNADEPSNRDLADGIKLILRKLWSEDDIKELITERHKELCAECPFRVAAAPALPAPAVDSAPDETDEAAPTGLTRRHVMLAVIKAPWLWLVVATICAIICYKVGVELPVIGGGNS